MYQIAKGSINITYSSIMTLLRHQLYTIPVTEESQKTQRIDIFFANKVIWGTGENQFAYLNVIVNYV